MFKKDPVKTVGGFAFTRYPASKCYKPKNDEVRTAKNVTKMNLRITAKCHAHLQTLTKTPGKFQKDLANTIGGVAFTRFCDTDGCMGKNNMSPDPDGGDITR